MNIFLLLQRSPAQALKTINIMRHRKTTLIFYSIFILLLLMNASCKTKREKTIIPQEGKQQIYMKPPVIIYKTKKDYFDKVPVGLSDDKMSVISYPDKIDIYYRGSFSTPTPLANGYLLDNRGIGPNSAFTAYTYDEYSRLEATPEASKLFFSIIDKDPFTEMYSCKCNKDTVEINRMIREGLAENCKNIK